MIITHPHPDHYRALPYLLDKIQIKKIYWNGHKTEEKPFQKLLKKINQTKIPLGILKKGDRFELIDECFLTCIHPEKLEEDYNDNSLVFLLSYKETSFLFTGDIGIPVQDELALNYPQELKNLDVLKLPHHGDILSVSFSQLVQDVPFPVLMTGANKYYLPKHETLKTFGLRLLRSDCCVDIVLETDGTSVRRITPEK